ncbi:hypothetical protein BX070DRAFT_37100 [Coemansia spiralis]|nr:hypothetical protein BX070DRAFT_37100 [Coemansia spiralis]
MGGFLGTFGQRLNQMLGEPNPFANAASHLVSYVQSLASDINSFNKQAARQVEMMAQMARSDISSFNSMLQTNAIVSAVLMPITNLSGFISNAQDALTDLESRVNTQISYINSEISYITSLAVYDVNAAATDIGKVLNSLYSFTQQGVEILISSPLLSAATILNPVIMLALAVIAADPVKMVTDYPAWQSEFSSRESVVNSNFNSVYTLVSTGLPQAESVIIGILSQLAKLTNNIANLRLQTLLKESLLSKSFGSSLNAAMVGIGNLSQLPGIDGSNNEAHAALQSVAYYHLYSSALSASTTELASKVAPEAVNMQTPTPAFSTAYQALHASPYPTSIQ